MFQLEIYHQRSAEWRRDAAAYRLAREARAASAGRKRRWPWPVRRPQPVRAPVAS